MKILWPVASRHITNDYGARESFRLPDGQWTLPFHYGVDFAQPGWAAAYASAKLTYEQAPEGEGIPPGENEGAITDSMILSAVQQLINQENSEE